MSHTVNPTGTVAAPLRFRGVRSHRARMNTPQDIQDELLVQAEATRKWRGQRPSMNGCMPVSVDATRPRLAAGDTRQQRRRESDRMTKHEMQRRLGKAEYARHAMLLRTEHGGWVKTPWGKVPAWFTDQNNRQETPL